MEPPPRHIHVRHRVGEIQLGELPGKPMRGESVVAPWLNFFIDHAVDRWINGLKAGCASSETSPRDSRRPNRSEPARPCSSVPRAFNLILGRAVPGIP